MQPPSLLADESQLFLEQNNRFVSISEFERISAILSNLSALTKFHKSSGLRHNQF